jgi:hypothetical protein
MSDHAIGKRMAEEMVLEQMLDTFAAITARDFTEDGADGAEQVEGSPDFIVGLDGQPFGIELAEIRDTTDHWDYFAEASRLAWQKHESYARRALFRFPIALAFHSIQPALFDMRRELASFDHEEFAGTGFAEVWAVDFSDAYYSAGHPLRRADMFCFKPREWFGFHRIGTGDRKPYG